MVTAYRTSPTRALTKRRTAARATLVAVADAGVDVRPHLIRRGTPWRRLLIAARGASLPVELDIDEQGRARNRRVAFRLMRRQAP